MWRNGNEKNLVLRGELGAPCIGLSLNVGGEDYAILRTPRNQVVSAVRAVKVFKIVVINAIEGGLLIAERTELLLSLSHLINLHSQPEV